MSRVQRRVLPRAVIPVMEKACLLPVGGGVAGGRALSMRSAVLGERVPLLVAPLCVLAALPFDRVY